MTPFELLAVIEDADVRAPRGKRRMILELTAPIVLGEKGQYLGVREVVDEDGRVQRVSEFGYTRRQCFTMRDAIYAAARNDLEGLS